MTSNPFPVTKRDQKIALDYFLGRKTRVEVNRAYKMREEASGGLHRAARALRQLASENPSLYAALESLTSSPGQ